MEEDEVVVIQVIHGRSFFLLEKEKKDRKKRKYILKYYLNKIIINKLI